jgi:DNA-binding MarR family transcriptional regulator
MNDIHQTVADATTLLERAAKELRATLADEPFIHETPLEAQAAMESALRVMGEAIRQLKVATREGQPRETPAPGGPTRQQGQFLAFINEYMMRNSAGVAPTHAELQQFFNLTPPSVNSMLIRLDRRGFIRRVPGKARSIEMAIKPELIPPLERPFKC